MRCHLYTQHILAENRCCLYTQHDLVELRWRLYTLQRVPIKMRCRLYIQRALVFLSKWHVVFIPSAVLYKRDVVFLLSVILSK
jgi:hypothetical protein